MSVEKVLSWKSLLEKREVWKREGKSVVWTNGCFDLIHVGHVRSLQAARRFGDVLVVGLNSDSSVRKLKGPERPVVPESERAEILAALECVNAVYIFSDDTPERPLAELRPDIHCKGEDYKPPHGKPIPEAALVAAYGGKIEFIPFEIATSTTGLIKSIKGS
ncbi:MAG: adenylyltransferase/cytidyltransferase family protein [bacterium]|jgi:rfaE bifunctional protein nucleotidyltransferase chain/domain